VRRSALASLLLAALMLAPAWSPATAGLGGPDCGNGTLDAGEGCDDGNNENGDCCSNGCAPETGNFCDDGDVCNGVDACSAEAACVPELEPVCDLQALKTSLSFDADKGTVSFGWQKGTVPFVELGDPTTADTDYFLCIDENDTEGVLALQAEGGGTCGTKPCWKTTGKAAAPSGFLFKSKEGAVRSVSLHASEAGKAKLALSAKGDPFAPLGALTPPVRARLSNGAQCWDAFFLDEQIKRNDGIRFKATRKGLPVM
jgi:cysteine-rich repeat protein